MEGEVTGRMQQFRAAAIAWLRRALVVAKRVLLIALRLALGGVLIYAGSRKAFATQEFARDIQNYGVLASADFILLLAIYLPWLEIITGAALIFRRLELGALIVTTVLMLIFTGALTNAWVRGLDIACGCFAEERSTIRTHYPELLARDLALLLTAIFLLRIARRTSRAAAVDTKKVAAKEF